jgi:tripartite-type tricarboxylate transporter receptor subunit TctC
MLKRLFLLIALVYPAAAHADWPQRPVTLVVPFAAGGITDVLARVTAERLTRAFGKPFIVENVVGAAGAIATTKVAKAAPDGHTLLFVTVTQLTVTPYMGKVTYDPIRDFAPVAIVATSPFVLTVGADFPAEDLQGFIAYVKARPNELTYGTAGSGSLSHLSAAVFLKRAGLDMVMVPYRGIAPAFSDLLGGSVQMVSATPVELKPFVDGKKLRLLASSGATRSETLPEVPAIAESMTGHDIETWNGIVAPAQTPKEIVDALMREIALAENDSRFVEQLKKLGVEPSKVAGRDFEAVIARDTEVWRKLIPELGLEAQP